MIDLAAPAQLAKLKGKEAPTLLATDARGVNKNTQISDYKGKWVALEFPEATGVDPAYEHSTYMMEIYDDHPDERDKYVVLTDHAPDTKTFPDLDQEGSSPVVRDTWAMAG